MHGTTVFLSRATFVRLQLNGFHGLAFTHEEADFAIPLLDDFHREA
jgi:hypothetical protein